MTRFAPIFLAFAMGMLTFAGYRAALTSWHPSDCQMLEALGVTPQAKRLMTQPPPDTETVMRKALQSKTPMPNRIWRT